MLLLSLLSTIIYTAISGQVLFYDDIWKAIIWFFGSYAAIALVFLAWFIIGSFFISKKKKYQQPSRYYKWVFDHFLEYVNWISGARVTTTGKELIPTDRRFLFVCNHLSDFDSLIHETVLPDYDIAYIAKKENSDIPFVGKYMYRLDYFRLDRKDLRASLQTIQQAAKYLESGRGSVGVFPEGTRNKTKDHVLLDFRSGCLKVATLSHSPIVVATIKDTNHIFRNFPWKKTKVAFDIIRVIEYKEYEKLSTIELGDMIKSVMLANLEKSGKPPLTSMQEPIIGKAK